jgi:hypothetical protein
LGDEVRMGEVIVVNEHEKLSPSDRRPRVARTRQSSILLVHNAKPRISHGMQHRRGLIVRTVVNHDRLKAPVGLCVERRECVGELTWSLKRRHDN